MRALALNLMNGSSLTIEGMVGRLAKMEVYQAIQFAVAETLVATTTIQEAAPRILRTIGSHLGWQLGLFWVYDKTTSCLGSRGSWQAPSVDGSVFIKKSKDLQFCAGESLPGRVWASGTPVWFADFPDQHFIRSELAKSVGLKSALAFPVFADLDCIGVMEFFSNNKVNEPIDTDTLDMLVNVGYRIGQFYKRRELEKHVKEAEMRYRVLIDSAHHAIIVADIDGCIVEWNAAAEAMFGWKKSEVVGQNLTTIMPLRYREAHLAGIDRIRKSDNTIGSRVIGQMNSLVGLHKDGSEFAIALTLSTWNTTGTRFFGASINANESKERVS